MNAIFAKYGSVGATLSFLLLALNGKVVGAEFPAVVTPPATMKYEERAAAAARWLGANTSDVALKDSTVPAQAPLSFDDSWNDYWRYLVANSPDYKAYSSQPNASLERVMTHQGTNIYDAAVWEIAMSVILDQKNAFVTAGDKHTYKAALLSYENLVANDNALNFQTLRAYAQSSENYLYGPQDETMPLPFKAYIRRFIAPGYQGNVDPLTKKEMNWFEYSAATGEEAWAALIGPLQASYLAKGGSDDWIWDQRIDTLAIPSLKAIAAMEDPVSGGVFRNVGFPRSDPSSGDRTVISVENNLSLYAGLRMLQKALLLREKTFANQDGVYIWKSNRLQAKSAVDDALGTTNALINGLHRFFSNASGKAPIYDATAKFFVAGLSKKNDNTYIGESKFATDVQTWGISVMTDYPDFGDLIKKTYGLDVLKNMWTAALREASYVDVGTGHVVGVGYGTQTPQDKFYQMSGEWTWGAVNAAIALASSQEASGEWSSAVFMIRGINRNIATLYSDSRLLGYLYANKRELIPFGWYSNAMPSTASTGWSVLVQSCYDPFAIGGASERARVCKLILAEADELP